MKSSGTIGLLSSNGPSSAARAGSALVYASKIERSIAYMREHLDEPLQVSRLAATANTSKSHFFVLFKRQTGLTPICYFIRLRMQRARELLQNGSLCVKEVAASLGYGDPFYFSRLFKSIHRVAPSEFRMSQKTRCASPEPESLSTPAGGGPAVCPGIRNLINNENEPQSVF